MTTAKTTGAITASTMRWAPHGEYHYEFFGFDHHDHHSNHMDVTVTIISE